MISWRVDSEEMADPEPVSLGLCGDKAALNQNGDPAANVVLVAPAVGHTWDEPAENVHVVVEDGEAADGDGEVLRDDFEPGLDPGLTVRHALAVKESPSHTSGNAVATETSSNCGLGIVIAGACLRIRGVPNVSYAPAAGWQELCLSF
jgi:hypothetical protein